MTIMKIRLLQPPGLSKETRVTARECQLRGFMRASFIWLPPVADPPLPRWRPKTLARLCNCRERWCARRQCKGTKVRERTSALARMVALEALCNTRIWSNGPMHLSNRIVVLSPWRQQPHDARGPIYKSKRMVRYIQIIKKSKFKKEVRGKLSGNILALACNRVRPNVCHTSFSV